jgi:hypothetical protein
MPPPPQSRVYAVANVAALRAFVPNQPPPSMLAVTAGYHATGDRGGGLFYWDISSASGDNGGTIIVPTGSNRGRWVRIYEGPVSAKMFGAYGDNTQDDTASLQAAINFCMEHGSELFIPAGTYLIMPQSNTIALYVAGQASGSIRIRGEGVGKTILNVEDNVGTGTALLIETTSSTQANQTYVGELSIAGVGSALPLELIVCHAAGVRLENINLSTCTRFGVLVESGTSGTAGGLTGVTLAPNGTYHISDQCQLVNVSGFSTPYFTHSFTATIEDFFQPTVGAAVTVAMNTAGLSSGEGNGPVPYVVLGASGGTGGGLYEIQSITDAAHAVLVNRGNARGVPVGNTVPSGTSVQRGALVYAHGSDASTCILDNVSSVGSNIAFIEGSLGGNLYRQCYSQDANVGYVLAGASGSEFLRCGTEDLDALYCTPGPVHLFIGGSLAAYAAILQPGQGTTESIGDNAASLTYRRPDASGNTFAASVPAPSVGAPIALGRKDVTTGDESTWLFAYNPDADPQYPFEIGSFLWTSFKNSTHNPGVDYFGGAFGMTDLANARGQGLCIIGSPTMNSQRHWTWKQEAVTILPGNHLVYLNGGAADNGSVPFLDDGTYNRLTGRTLWTNAKRSLKVEIEFGNISDLSNYPLTVTGYTFVEKTPGPPATYNAACNVTNPANSNVTVTLVWTFEMFVPNYDTVNIG